MNANESDKALNRRAGYYFLWAIVCFTVAIVTAANVSLAMAVIVTSMALGIAMFAAGATISFVGVVAKQERKGKRSDNVGTNERSTL